MSSLSDAMNKNRLKAIKDFKVVEAKIKELEKARLKKEQTIKDNNIKIVRKSLKSIVKFLDIEVDEDIEKKPKNEVMEFEKSEENKFEDDGKMGDETMSEVGENGDKVLKDFELVEEKIKEELVKAELKKEQTIKNMDTKIVKKSIKSIAKFLDIVIIDDAQKDKKDEESETVIEEKEDEKVMRNQESIGENDGENGDNKMENNEIIGQKHNYYDEQRGLN